MRVLAVAGFVTFGCGMVWGQAGNAPPVAPVRPVTDTYFGTAVVDPYRWMETSTDELQAYLRAENAVTAEAMRPLAGQDVAVLEELRALVSKMATTARPTRVLDQFFYLELPAGKSDYRLMVRPVNGGEARLLLDPTTLAESGKHAAVDYFVPSPDGSHVAVGVSLGGSENSVLRVVETGTGTLMGEVITRAQEGAPSWVDDGTAFYFSRLQEMVAGAAAGTKFDNMRVYLHRLGAAEGTDVAVFGPDVAGSPTMPKNGGVQMEVVPRTGMLLASQVSGVVETPAYWVRRSEGAAWVPVVAHEEGVMDTAMHGTRLYAKTKGGAGGAVSNGRVVSFDVAKEGFAAARVELPDSGLVLSGRTGSGLAAASDAMYVFGARDGLGVMVRLPYGAGAKPSELKLPLTGAVLGVAAEERRPGVVTVLTGWTTPRLDWRYDPATGKFSDTQLQPADPADFSGVQAVEVEAKSADGTMVPLSILYRKDLKRDGTAPTLLEAYGAYGTSIPPHFNGRLLPWLNRGGVVAFAHVRGGGEKGEAWHLAGMKTTKQHTIDDFVACARYLEKGYTSAAHLGISGTSAGGIAVGGFLTQHPELVGAVLYRVGITDMLRSEQRSTGAQNAFEYGSVKVEPEFRAMAAISPYQHVVDGAKYPAVLLETGANDPRVTSWMLTKMTARMQAASADGKGSGNPVLLRVDFDAGHGIGSGRDQALKLLADEYTFLGWRLAMAGFQPSVAASGQ